MVVDDDDLAARFDDAQGFGQGAAAHRFRLFVKQKEQQHLVVTGIGAGQRGRVAMQQRSTRGSGGSFLPRFFNWIGRMSTTSRRASGARRSRSFGVRLP